MDNLPPKIVPLKKNSVVDTLETLLKMAKEDKLGGFIAAGFIGREEQVFVSVVDVDCASQYALIGHLNSNATLRTIRETYGTK